MAIFELKSKYSAIIKFLIHTVSIPISEAVCGSQGPVINRVILKRTTANDRKMAEMDSTDMRVFIMLNSLPSKYKITAKFLEVLIKKYGMSC